MPGSNRILRNTYGRKTTAPPVDDRVHVVYKPKKPPKITPAIAPLKVDGTYYVQNKQATSYEYNVSKALDDYGLSYQFQVPVGGGRRISGGQVLDFLVNTAPLQTPVYVNGDYWHKDQQQEFQQTQLLDYYTGGTLNKALVLWGIDTATPDAAHNSIRLNFV